MLCAVLRVPGFKTGPEGSCPRPTVDPRDPARRLEYIFKIYYQ